MGNRRSNFLMLLLLGAINYSYSQDLALILPNSHASGFYDGEFSPDGRRIITTSPLGPAKYWDVISGKLLMNIHDGANSILKVKFFQRNDLVVVLSGSYFMGSLVADRCRIFDLRTKTYVSDLLPDDGSEIIQIDVSRDDKYVIIMQRRDTKIWSIRENRFIGGFINQGYQTAKIDFDSKANKFLVRDVRDSYFLFDAKTGVRISDGTNNKETSVAFEPVFEKYSAYVRISDNSKSASESTTGKMLYTPQQPLSDTSGNVTIYEPDGRIRKRLSIILPKGCSAVISPNSTMLLFYQKAVIGSEAVIWDIETKKMLSVIQGYASPVFDNFLSTDGNHLISSLLHGGTQVFSLSEAKPLATIFQNDMGIAQFAELSGSGRLLVTSSSRGKTCIWDMQSGKLLSVLADSSTVINFCEFNKSETEIIVRQFKPNNIRHPFKLFRVKDGKLLDDWGGAYDYNPVRPGFEGTDTLKRLEITEGVQKLIIVAKGDFREYVMENLDYIVQGAVSLNRGIAVTVARNNRVRLWDIKTGTEKSQFRVPGGSADYRINLESDKLLVTYDGMPTVYNLSNGKVYLKIIVGRDNQWLLLNNDGYYKASKEINKQLHYVTEDYGIVEFSQLDLRYNRPDKLLASVDRPDTALVNAYRQAFAKRMERLNIDTNALRHHDKVPLADIVNRSKITGDQTSNMLRLLLKASSTSPLDRYHVWVNEVPIYGQPGKSLRDKQIKELNSLPVDVELTPGRNKIEFSVFNANGMESYRQPLYVNYNPAVPPPEKVYFIGIGINQFASNTNSLNWCVNDIRDLVASLKRKAGTGFVLIDTVFDSRVTLQNILKLKARLMETGINDKVIISFSGHGLLSAKYDYYLSGYNVDFNSPENGGIPYEVLEGLLDSIPARKKLLLLDACNSGEVDKGAALTAAIGKGSKGIGGKVQPAGADKNKVGLSNSFELMRELFINVNRGTGATVIAAAQGYQSALEQNKIGHGVFTYSIIDALKSRTTIKVSELKKWVSENVLELTEGKQQPTTRIEPVDVDWSVW